MSNKDKKFLEKVYDKLYRTKSYIRLTDQQIQDILMLVEETLKDYEIKPRPEIEEFW